VDIFESTLKLRRVQPPIGITRPRNYLKFLDSDLAGNFSVQASIFCNSEITRQKKEFRVQEQPIMGERSIYWCSKSNYFNCSKYSSEIPFMLLLHLLKIDKFEFTNFLNILNFGVNLRNNSSHFPIKLFHCVAESRGRCSFDIGIDIEWLIF